MGLFDNLFKAKETKAETEPFTIYCPIKGNIVSLKEIGDGVFSEEVLGKGCGIIPSGETVSAPFNGTVIQTCDTKHAIGIESEDGIELLIHVGMDTVEMNGTGFEVLVKQGEKVHMGQPVLKFSISEIERAGYSTIAAVVITNSSDFEDISFKTNVTMEQSESLGLVKK